MKTTTYLAAMAGVLTLVVMLVFAAAPALAGSGDNTAPTIKGGEGVVTGVDRPDNCLRVRRGPSTSDEEVACVAKGETVRLTGVFSRDGRWAQLDDGGWVFFNQIKTDVPAPRGITSGSGSSPTGAGWRRPAASGSGSGRKQYRQDQMTIWY